MATLSRADVGATNITTLGVLTTGTWNASLIPLAKGGLNANLTASNGGIFYSTGTAAAILAGTATATETILSGSSSAPSWSPYKMPNTVSANNLVYASNSTTVTGLSPSSFSILSTTTTPAPAYVSLNGAGNLLIGSTGGNPAEGVITAGGNITVSNGSNSITISQRGPVNQTTATRTVAAGICYLCNAGASLITYTLPASPTAGDFYEIVGTSAGGWTIAQNASQSIELPGGTSTTVGTGGSISSNNQWDCIRIRYTETTNVFQVERVIGNPSYV